MPTKELIVVGGPNGAGKSTFVAQVLAEGNMPYLSADLIATEFADLTPTSQQLAAGREFLLRIEKQLVEGQSFIVETTMSGRTLQHFLDRARAAGYVITMIFIYLDSADTSLARVQERVRRGGHNVPEEDIRRRFARCFVNFWHIYRRIADYWYVIYNSSGEFKRIASGELEQIAVRDELAFRQFLRIAGGTHGIESDD